MTLLRFLVCCGRTLLPFQAFVWMILGPHVTDRIPMLPALCFCSVLLMPAPGSESFECAVFPSSLLSQSHQCYIRRKNKPPPHTYSCLLFLLFQEKDYINFLCKGITPGPHVLLFFYSEALIFSSHCFQRQYSTLLMKYFTYICLDLINTPELEVHQCYWKYLFELSFK